MGDPRAESFSTSPGFEAFESYQDRLLPVRALDAGATTGRRLYFRGCSHLVHRSFCACCQRAWLAEDEDEDEDEDGDSPVMVLWDR